MYVMCDMQSHLPVCFIDPFSHMYMCIQRPVHFCDVCLCFPPRSAEPKCQSLPQGSCGSQTQAVVAECEGEIVCVCVCVCVRARACSAALREEDVRMYLLQLLPLPHSFISSFAPL